MKFFNYANWITAEGCQVTKEPTFSLKDMFLGNANGHTSDPEERLLSPRYFFKAFDTDENIVKAKLRITARGLYKAYINGKTVTEAIFTPDYTSYENYLMVQEYDVTNLLKENNLWTVILSDGWYAGRVSVQGGSAQFGDELALIAEIELEYIDGTKEYISTDDSFIATSGKHVYSDIFIGEMQDLQKTISITNLPSKQLIPVLERNYSNENLVKQVGPQVVERQMIPAKKIWREEASWIIDFGQILAGYATLELNLDIGQRIQIEHSEVIDEQGNFINNIVGRNKEQTDIYIGRGQKECLRPDFTFHGFRYLKVSGYEGDISLKQAHAIVIFSDVDETGQFSCSNQDINRLMENIKWSQKGNMISIPTDCPQRERVGWTGDIQVFAPTATFFYDMKSFLMRWLDNVVVEQLDNGEILDYTPAPKDFYQGIDFTGSLSSAGWGDAIVMIPFELYNKYGDATILRRYYDAMLKWHEFSKKSAQGDKTGHKKYIWDTKFHYGDWMFPSFMLGKDAPGPMATAEATKDIVATAFLANTSYLLAKISEILDENPQPFYDYHELVKAAYNTEFINEDGSMKVDLQGCLVLTLAFDLVEDKNKIVSDLHTLIQKNNFRLDTGFLSIPYLLDVLSENGYTDTAFKVLFQRACPSWLYEIDHGATTIWESWAAIQPDGEVTKSSFNHYAFGCVGDWIVRNIAGLQVKEPGFKEFSVAPRCCGEIKEFEMTYQCLYGRISIKKVNNTLTIVVPKETRAYLYNDDVLEAGIHTIDLNKLESEISLHEI
ncbi:alpha-L-rhamnosidase [Enterococcus sp. JM4C]|uniref:alpha-L-rhamnosidase n=1 Tax=Candidatus Enterococcus huntleyi TaxID=1857217 RepID=UPI001379B597|nr:alpha-L-rhamnosidase [Enterococcus sp. JM4C]KAF1297544.1 alpha-L-rhamnosidase [Enterococcus sp. JM4C]